MSQKKKVLKALPWILIGFSTSYLCLMLTLSYLIDFLHVDMFGLRSFINNYSNPYFWMFVFIEGSITEHIQWAFLIIVLVIVVLHILKTYRKFTNRDALPWFLFFIGVYLMFLEDRSNIRHLISQTIGSRLLGQDIYGAAWETSMIRSSIELFFYFIVSCTMLSAFVLIIKKYKNLQQGTLFLLTGYLLYGFAAFASATRNIGNWYAVVGTKVLDLIIAGRDIGWTASTIPTFSWKPLGFWFMDFVVEESIELMAVTFLLAAVLIFLPLTKNNEEMSEQLA